MIRLGILVLAEPNNGVFQYTLSMLEAVRYLEGWNVTLYSTPENHHYDGEGYPVRRIRADRKNWPSLVVRDLLNLGMPDPFEGEDILLAPYHSPILLHTRKPFYYTLHDLQEQYFPENFSWPRRVWRGLINSRLAKRAARVICESEYVRRDIVRVLGMPPDRVTVIAAPPVTMPASACSAALVESTRAKYQLPDRYLFYPAQFWAHKNHLRLLDAFSQVVTAFPDVHLVLTGRRCYEYRRILTRVSDLGLEKRVRHIGPVDQSDLGVLYRCALALVMPSLFESVSLPVYEAFQCGTPVCASNVVAIPEQVGGAGLLFDPYSVDSIVESMSRMLESDELRQRLAILGRARFEAMTHEAYAKQLAALLTSSDGSMP